MEIQAKCRIEVLMVFWILRCQAELEIGTNERIYKINLLLTIWPVAFQSQSSLVLDTSQTKNWKTEKVIQNRDLYNKLKALPLRKSYISKVPISSHSSAISIRVVIWSPERAIAGGKQIIFGKPMPNRMLKNTLAPILRPICKGVQNGLKIETKVIWSFLCSSVYSDKDTSLKIKINFKGEHFLSTWLKLGLSWESPPYINNWRINCD